MPILTLLFVAVAAESVIAAPDPIDHPAAERVFSLFDALWLVGAIVSIVLIVRFRWASLRSAPDRPEAFAPITGLVLAGAMFLAGPLALRVAASAGGIELPDTGEAAASLAIDARARLGLVHYAGQGVFALVFLALLWNAPRPDRDRRSGIERSVLLGAAAIALVWPIVSASGWLTASILVFLGGSPPDPIAHEALRAIVGEPADAWLLVLFAQIVLAAPVMEEIFYRGLLQESLRRLGAGPWPSIVLTSLVFAWMHWQNTAPHAVVALFVLSLGLGWSYERSGRLTSPIVMHMVFNVGNLAIARLIH